MGEVMISMTPKISERPTEIRAVDQAQRGCRSAFSLQKIVASRVIVTGAAAHSRDQRGARARCRRWSSCR